MTSVGKLSDGGDGWVNGITHHPTPNKGPGVLNVPSATMGALMHTMVGNLPGTDSWFLNPASQASAHFGVAQDGTTIQWVSIRTGPVAWHAVAANDSWYGIEFADNQNPANPLTEAQLNRAAQLTEFLSRTDVGRFALQVTNDPGTEGLGTHSMGGDAWGSHNCPGTVRAGQRAEIIRRAKILRTTGQYPPPADVDYRHQVGAGNTLSLAAVAARRHTTVQRIVEISREHLNAANDAILTTYLALDAALTDAGHPHPAMPEGLVYWTDNP